MNRFIAVSLTILASIWPTVAKGFGEPVSLSLSTSCLKSISEVQQEIIDYISTDKGRNSMDWSIPNFGSHQSIQNFYNLHGFPPNVMLETYDVSQHYYIGTSQEPLNLLSISYVNELDGVIKGRANAIHSSPQYKLKLTTRILSACHSINQIVFGLSRVTGSEDFYGRDLNSSVIYKFRQEVPSCGFDGNGRIVPPRKLNWGEAYSDC